MPKYEGYECPVCKKPFEEGDDIVTCPECGTPHHRECYNLSGKCVNSGLHSSGFEFNAQPKKIKISASNDNTDNVVGQYYTPKKSDDSNTESTVINIDLPKKDETEYEKSNETINGNSIGDVSATIRTNIPRFISKFRNIEKSGKKIGWNWGAFFFGSLYYLFRKMYKQGFSLLCVFMALDYGCYTSLNKFAPKYVEAIMDFSTKYANRETIDPNMLMTSDFASAEKVMYITIAILLFIRIIEALFADYVYMNTVNEIIEKMKKQLDENMSFSVSPLMGSDNNLSQDQMRRMYLTRRGGVSIFAPMTAFLLIETILQLLL